MKRLLTLLAASVVTLGLAGCAPRPASTAPNAAQFVPVSALPDVVFAGPDDAMDYFLQSVGRTHPTTLDVDSKPSGPATMVLTFSAEGLEDDSLAGKQWRVELTLGDQGSGYEVTAAGERYKCYRGGSSAWRTTLCP